MTAEEYLEEMDKNSNDINDIIEEAMIGYARIKCEELLLLVAEKASKLPTTIFIEPGTCHTARLSKDSILNAVDLDSFCS